jgi:hypothetical protein
VEFRLKNDGLMGTDSVAALVAAVAPAASGGAGLASVTVGLAVKAAAASERAAGGAGTVASEQVWADNGLMDSVIAVALDAAAAWEVAGFVGIGFGIVRLLIGATAAATEVGRWRWIEVRLVKVDFSGAISLCHTFSTVGIVHVKKILQRPKWVRSLRGWHYISPGNLVLHTIGEP